MTDDKTQPTMNGQSEQAKPERMGQQGEPSQAAQSQGRQSQTGEATRPVQRVGAGRQPLFRR
jgi:hypothetical protein